MLAQIRKMVESVVEADHCHGSRVRAAMRKFDIQVATERCTGCLMCQLACSDYRNKVFNPSLARVVVDVSGLDCSIDFTEECDECGICADYCFYGALQKEPRETVE